MFRCFAGDGKRRDLDIVDCRAAGARLDGCYTRDDGGHADGNEELVRASVNLFEDIFAADVCVSSMRSDKKAEKEKGTESRFHRCTLRIHRPKLRPTQVPMEP